MDNQESYTTTTTFADAEEMAAAFRKAVAASRAKRAKDTSAPNLTVSDLPALFRILVALGLLTLEQAQTLLAAFESGGDALLHLPDIPSASPASMYMALKAHLAEASQTDSIFDFIGDALEWVADHLVPIASIIEAIMELIES